jgi:hypothetical protein
VTPSNSYPVMSAWLERAWLARYLDGLLSEDEAAWFEEYVLDKPELLAMIDADTRLREAMMFGGAEYYAASAATSQVLPGDSAGNAAALSDTGDAPVTPMRQAPRPNRAGLGWLALAAALVLGLGIGRMTLRMNAADALIANPTHVVYDTVRGAAIPPRIEQVDSGSPYVLVEVSVPPGAEKVTLHMDTGADATLSPAPNGFVSFLLLKTQIASSKEARVDYTVNGRQQSRPISFRELHREK